MRDFLKCKAGTAKEVRFIDGVGDTIGQCNVKCVWIDGVLLKGSDVHDVGYDILT